MPRPEAEVVEEIRARSQRWFDFFAKWRKSYWILGVAAVTFSTLAAANQVSGDFSPYFAVASSICIGIIGFANPQRRALGYLRAWRILSICLLEYDAGKVDVTTLLKCVESGEAVIGEADDAKLPQPH